MKRILACLLFLALLMSCVSFAVAEEEPVTLRIVWWGNQGRHDTTVAALNKFMEKHPNIKVEYEFTDWGSYFSKLSTQAVGNLMPDVIQITHAYVSQYATSGLLEDLTPHVESGALNMNNIPMSVLDAARVNDGVYALSTGSNALVYAYRKDVLDQAGLTMPKDPTMSQVAELRKQVYEKTGRHSVSLYTLAEMVALDLRNYGLNLFNADNSALGFDDPKYIAMTFERYQNAIKDGYELPMGEELRTSSFDVFASDSWDGYVWTNQVAAYEEGSGCELELAVLPQLDDATVASTYFQPTMMWAISKDSDVKEAALELVNFLIHDTDYYDVAGMDRGLPNSSEIRAYLEPSFDATGKKVSEIMDYLGQEGKTSAMSPLNPPEYKEICALFDQYMEQVKYDLVDDLTAHAQAFMDEANEILRKGRAAE